MRKSLIVIAVVALVVGLAPTSGAYHAQGCGSFPTQEVAVQFGGDFDPAGQNWMNACTPAGNVYFFGSFGNVAGGDPSGMCGYVVVDGHDPVDMYVGMQGNVQGGAPNPQPVLPADGDWDPNHDTLACGIRG